MGRLSLMSHVSEGRCQKDSSLWVTVPGTTFYEIRMEDGCFYIHVYDLKKTVYLIAASQAGRVAEFTKQGTPCNFQITAAQAIS